jgi:hypothetical protein
MAQYVILLSGAITCYSTAAMVARCDSVSQTLSAKLSDYIAPFPREACKPIVRINLVKGMQCE